MAGVGFELNKLFAKNSKTSRFSACFWSALSCCGSMILSFILLFFINLVLKKTNTTNIEATIFTTYITNIVMLSMIIYSFFSYPIARYLSDLIYENKTEKIISSFYGILSIILTIASIIIIPLLIISKINHLWIFLLTILLFTFIATWVIIGYVTILKYYKKICLAFLGGFFASIATILIGILTKTLSYELLFISLIIGYGITFTSLYYLVNKYFKSRNSEIFDILKYFSKYKSLAFTGLFLTLGTLIPFYIFWFSKNGDITSFFFRSASFYDLPAILAYLTTIFTTIYFVSALEPNFYPYYKKYFNLLNNNGYYKEITEAKEMMISILKKQLHQLIIIQVIITIVASIFLSKFLFLLNIGLTQSMLGTYKLLCVGYCLMAIGNSVLLIIIYFADYKSSLKVASAFFVLTAIFTYISTILPHYYWGCGVIAGALVMCISAIYYLERLLDNLEYFILSEKGLYKKTEKYKFFEVIMNMTQKFTKIFNIKVRVIMYSIIAVALIISFVKVNYSNDIPVTLPTQIIGDEIILNQVSSNKILSNPGVGFAPWANTEETIKMNTRLVYVDMSWREIEPKKGVYDFKTFEKKNHLETYKTQNRNVVFRFYMDYPSKESKMDIPDWLYEEIDADGTWYDNEYGKGFSPNYNNKTLIKYYQKLIEEIGKKYGNDDFFLYIEMGALGHWGEWHVKYDDGIDRLPNFETRKNYVEPFVNFFPNSQLLMRYPVIDAEKYKAGLFNDMLGHSKETNYWLEMMQGGKWSQTNSYELVKSDEVWKSYPIGGEFTSSLADEFMLILNLKSTIEQIKDSHQTFIGPKVITDLSKYNKYEESFDEILRIMGHRLYVSKLKLLPTNDTMKFNITIKNDGVAPIYTDVNTILHIYTIDNRKVLSKDISEFVDINSVTAENEFEFEFGLNQFIKAGETYRVAISLDDPITEKPIIELAMQEQIEDRIYLIGKFTAK